MAKKKKAAPKKAPTKTAFKKATKAKKAPKRSRGRGGKKRPLTVTVFPLVWATHPTALAVRGVDVALEGGDTVTLQFKRTGTEELLATIEAVDPEMTAGGFLLVKGNVDTAFDILTEGLADITVTIRDNTSATKFETSSTTRAYAFIP